MIETRRSTSGGRVWIALLSASLAAILWSTAFAAEAKVIDRQRYSFMDVSHERTCGRDLMVVTTTSGISMTRSSHGGLPSRFYDQYNIHEVLTDAAGEGYIIDLSGLYTEVRVRHVRGSLYRYTAKSVGQVFTIRALDGKAVEHNSGLLEITFLLDTKGDSDPGNDVYRDFRLVKIAGTQPLQTQTDAEFCAVIEEAIAG
jgi:hypothetical protein